MVQTFDCLRQQSVRVSRYQVLLMLALGIPPILHLCGDYSCCVVVSLYVPPSFGADPEPRIHLLDFAATNIPDTRAFRDWLAVAAAYVSIDMPGGCLISLCSCNCRISLAWKSSVE